MGHVETQDIQHSGEQVSELHLLGHALPRGEECRVAHDQGHVNQRVVQTVGMAHEAMITDVFPVVAGDDEQRAVQYATLAQPGHERPNLGIEAGERAIVARLAARRNPPLTWISGQPDILTGHDSRCCA